MACAVKVNNISSKATIKEIEEFFAYAGQIESINLNSDGEDLQIAHVTFKEQDSLKIALLLSGSTILDKEVTISAVAKSGTEELALEPSTDSNEAGGSSPLQSRPRAINRAQEIVKSMLSRGLFVGKDAMKRAKSLDEKSKKAIDDDALKCMNEISNQKSKVSNVDDDDDVSSDNKTEESKDNGKEGNKFDGSNDNDDQNAIHKEAELQGVLGGKQSKGGSNNVRESMQKYYRHVCAMNEKLQIGQRTMSALTSAQQGVANAGSAVANNKLVAAGGVWVSGALSRVSLKSSTTSHDGEGTSPNEEHVQLTEMTSFSSHKSEND